MKDRSQNLQSGAVHSAAIFIWQFFQQKPHRAKSNVAKLQQCGRLLWQVIHQNGGIFRPFGRLVYRLGCPNSRVQKILF